MTEPVVSVVLPTRNRAELLPLAIRSALGQTFSDLEVLVVDDASDDETPRVVAGFSDPRIRSHRLGERSGGAAARNFGILRSRGEFVAFLDDDDEWLPNKLEKQIGACRRGSERVAVVYASYLVVERETGRVLGRKAADRRGDLSEVLLERNVVGGTSSVLVRRSCFERVGLFDETLPSFQDYDLWIRLAREFDFDFVEEDLLKYYVHTRKIWSDPDALDRGIDIMLQKHFASSALRRNLASQSLRVGVQFCTGGAMVRGRRAFLRSMDLRPFAARAYLNFGLSFFGGDGFRFAHDLWQRINRPRTVEGATPPASAGGIPREAGR